MLYPTLDLGVTGHGVVSRRGFLKAASGTCAAATLLGVPWRSAMLAQAEELRKRGKSMILLWMDGGPSQFDCFNPKIGSENQGPTKAISTKLPGFDICELWPKTAQVMDKIAMIRSMKSKEAEHDRAITHLRTGYPPSPVLRYPTWGSIVAHEREDRSFDLPPFVRVGKPRIANRDVDAGVLGVAYSPFKVDEAGKLPDNTLPTVDAEVLKRRLARRLVEQGVSFVEVLSTGNRNDQGWDTHKKGNEDVPYLCNEADPAYAALLTDLADRGMLDNTLVVWMGEFGRTPKLKSDGGRDHYAEGWQVGLSGAGVKMGQVIGATDKDGVKVTERPIGVQDLFATFAHLLGINPTKEYITSDNRPIRLVEGGTPIPEIIGA